jgi:hypothetical protein
MLTDGAWLNTRVLMSPFQIKGSERRCNHVESTKKVESIDAGDVCSRPGNDARGNAEPVDSNEILWRIPGGMREGSLRNLARKSPKRKREIRCCMLGGYWLLASRNTSPHTEREVTHAEDSNSVRTRFVADDWSGDFKAEKCFLGSFDSWNPTPGVQHGDNNHQKWVGVGRPVRDGCCPCSKRVH